MAALLLTAAPFPTFAGQLLGLGQADLLSLDRAVRSGLSYQAVERLAAEIELPLPQISDLIQVPSRTLLRRKSEGRLHPDESDRLMRLLRVFSRALELFEGDAESARRWLGRPLPALGGASPLRFAMTDVGAQEVDALIGRLEHGVIV
ncbi:MAG: antitoxin Xre/MbcA/ParS toxin-binding domain-containing protein [Thermoanaerobaculia bacterium]|nr:antitoxin Xre/MbcA/ParS toxin-binding domain-containing protein [Thermoanaerobaculia bacterium]